MTIHKALHPRGDRDRLYVSRKEGGQRTAQRQLEEYTKRAKTDYFWQPTIAIVIYGQTEKHRKQKWEEKQLYGYFKRQIEEVAHEKTWTWLR